MLALRLLSVPHPQVARFALLLLLALLLTGCLSTPTPSPTPSASSTPVLASPSPTSTLAPTSTPLPTSLPQPSPTSTALPSPTASPSPSPIPTYTVLRGEVVIDQAVCHYGPGAPYLYKYGVIRGSNLEIIRRVIGHNYIEVQAIGGNNPCWVRADYMQVKNGDLSSLQPVHPFDVKLPITPYYGVPGGVNASRDGSQVAVSWPPLILKAGDDSEQTPYIIEAWVCRAGQMVFDPVPARTTAALVLDEPGCAEPSRAYLIYAEKHGYTPRLPIPWPPAAP